VSVRQGADLIARLTTGCLESNTVVIFAVIMTAFWRGLYIRLRLIAAAIAWFCFASLLAMIKAQALTPNLTQQRDAAWQELRIGTLNPSTHTRTLEETINAKYSLPSAALVFTGIPARVLTNNLVFIGVVGLVSWAGSMLLIRRYARRERALGLNVEFGEWGLLVFLSIVFIAWYSLFAFLTGVLLKLQN